MAVRVGPDAADKAASVVGAVVALAGLALSVWQLLRTPEATAPRVRATGTGSIAVGGDMAGNAVGTGSKTTYRPTTAPVPAPAGGTPAPGADVEAADGGVATGGNMHGNALGNDSEVQ
ncbi:hypothetical protein [Streptomyces sp. NRRL B-24484]|uniref:hypothetical protein n=1 Tax=Streptomyces sp. NRRL B-24484 TaxID=1463833 RepID=UPI00133145D8|nr:hypothetical protein [Streptomyces sp. NRRL B-24484]